MCVSIFIYAYTCVCTYINHHILVYYFQKKCAILDDAYMYVFILIYAYTCVCTCVCEWQCMYVHGHLCSAPQGFVQVQNVLMYVCTCTECWRVCMYTVSYKGTSNIRHVKDDCHADVHVYRWECVQIWACIYICICTIACTYVYVRACVCILCAYICKASMYICTHTPMNVYIYIYILLCVGTKKSMKPLQQCFVCGLMCMCICVNMRVYYTCIFVCTSAVCVFVHTHRKVCMYTYPPGCRGLINK
jgi:hypothetical protein